MDRQEALQLLRGGTGGVAEWNARIKQGEKAPSLRGANLRRAVLAGINLSMARLDNAKLVEADLSEADLSYSNLKDANLIGASLRRCKLVGAHLAGASLASCNLSEADLFRANLVRAVLVSAKLQRADLREANLCAADLAGASASSADLRDAVLRQANLIGIDFEGSNLDGCSVYGASVWDAKLHGATQRSLRISEAPWGNLTVDNLEVAQFIYLLLHNEKIREIINTITSKAVLILGRFTPERKQILDAIREELRRQNYCPVVFDFETPASRDTHETVAPLARMARFVIADITDPRSIPQELVSVVESLPSVPVQPLLASGHEPWGMFDHIKRYPWVLAVHTYEGQHSLLSSIAANIIEPVESKAHEQRKR